MAKKRTICIDFDGVLHDYSDGWKGKDVFGDMIPKADVATQILKEKGWTIIIYTTRPATDKLKEWLKDNKISYDYINENPDQPKDSEGCKLIADVYVDDRAVRFSGQWDWLMNDIASFRPWQEGQEKDKKRMERQYDEGSFWLKKQEKDPWDCAVRTKY